MVYLERYAEAKALLRKMLPVARRVLGDKDGFRLKMRCTYAQALYLDASATLDDLREAVETFADAERIAQRMLGVGHPLTAAIERDLRKARAALRARETPPRGT